MDMRLLELLSARLCHELISPIAAVNNGVELLAEDDPSFMKDALALVGESARKASIRLQFYRFAYGASAGATLGGPPPCELASGLFSDGRVSCDYAGSVRALPMEWQKLGCNLLLVGAEAVARGGRVTLSSGGDGIALDAIGEGASLSDEIDAALAHRVGVQELTSRTIQPYFTQLLAKALSCRLEITARQPAHIRFETLSIRSSAD